MSKQQIVNQIDIYGVKFDFKHLELDHPINWHQANIMCEELGNEWRLPTKSELELLYIELYQKGKGNFKPNYYWSKTETSSLRVWALHFGYSIEDFGYRKNSSAFVCAVRTI